MDGETDLRHVHLKQFGSRQLKCVSERRRHDLSRQASCAFKVYLKQVRVELCREMLATHHRFLPFRPTLLAATLHPEWQMFRKFYPGRAVSGCAARCS